MQRGLPRLARPRHHARRGHRLVEAGQPRAQAPAPRPAHCHAHHGRGVSPVAAPAPAVHAVRVLITLARAHARTPRILPRTRGAVTSRARPLLLVRPRLSPCSCLLARSGLVAGLARGLVPAVDNEAGTGGGEPGLDTLLVLARGSELTIPHPLDGVLDVRQLTYLRLCNT